MKTLEEIFIKAAYLKVGVSLYVYLSKYSDPYQCSIEARHEEDVIKINTTSKESPTNAVNEAWERFERLVFHGNPRFVAPMLEHAGEAKSVDEAKSVEAPSDEIPF